MKIYLSGTINGNYRAQNIIKALSDSGTPYLLTPVSFFTVNASSRYLKLLIGLVAALLLAPARIWFIAVSTHLLVLPMNFSWLVISELLLARLLGKRVIVDYYIGLYDTFVNDRKKVRHNGIQAKLLRAKDWLLLTLASKVIFLNQAEADYYQSVVGVNLDDSKVESIPLCIDYKNEAFSPKPKDITGTGTLHVCWWGTYIPLHGLEKIIRAFVHLKDKDIKLYLFGDSDTKAVPYMRLIEECGVEAAVSIDNSMSFMNGKLAPFLVQHCDIALGNFGDSDKAKTVLVNKLVDALSLGMACLTMKTKAIDELLSNNNSLYYCAATPEDIAEQLTEIADNRQELYTKGTNGFNTYLELFSPDVFRRKLMKILAAT